MVLVEETALATWVCPICGLENTSFLIEGEPLPDELHCSFCEHESGSINWLS